MKREYHTVEEYGNLEKEEARLKELEELKKSIEFQDFIAKIASWENKRNTLRNKLKLACWVSGVGIVSFYFIWRYV